MTSSWGAVNLGKGPWGFRNPKGLCISTATGRYEPEQLRAGDNLEFHGRV